MSNIQELLKKIGATLEMPSNRPPPFVPTSNVMPALDAPIAQPSPTIPFSPMVEDARPQLPPLGEVAPVALPTEQPAPILPALSPSQVTQNEINDITGRRYNKAQYNPDGSIKVEAGKDRDKDWTWKDKLASLAVGSLEGLAKGGIGGAIGGGIGAATNRNYMEQRRDKEELARQLPRLDQQQQAETFQTQQDTRRIANQNVLDDNAQRKAEFNTRTAYNRDEQTRKIGDRISREKTSRMTTVAGMLKNIPSYDPSDPRFAELTKALGDVNLPLTPKDAKKNVKLVQDQRTGDWSTILTDPITGTQETRPVLDKDGKAQFKSTPTVVMQGELGINRQNDQQDFTADQNERNRQLQLQRDDTAAKLRLQLEEVKRLNAAATAEQNFERRKALQEQAQAARLEAITLTNALRPEKK